MNPYLVKQYKTFSIANIVCDIKYPVIIKCTNAFVINLLLSFAFSKNDFICADPSECENFQKLISLPEEKLKSRLNIFNSPLYIPCIITITFTNSCRDMYATVRVEMTQMNPAI